MKNNDKEKEQIKKDRTVVEAVIELWECLRLAEKSECYIKIIRDMYDGATTKVKGKMYKSVVRPTMLYGMETVAMMERQVGKIEVAELKMVR